MSKHYTWILLTTTAILWNGWLLAIFVYPYEVWSHMEISELAIKTQPWSAIFRGLDGLSALFMIAAALLILLMFLKKQLKIWFAIAACLLACIGFLTFFDITHSLDCVQYQNSECSTKIEKHLVSNSDNLHNAESLITSYISIALAIYVIVLAYRYSPSLMLRLISISIAIGILWSLAILNETKDLFVYGINDRLWNLLISGDLIMIGTILPKQTTRELQP